MNKEVLCADDCTTVRGEGVSAHFFDKCFKFFNREVPLTNQEKLSRVARHLRIEPYEIFVLGHNRDGMDEYQAEYEFHRFLRTEEVPTCVVRWCDAALERLARFINEPLRRVA